MVVPSTDQRLREYLCGKKGTCREVGEVLMVNLEYLPFPVCGITVPLLTKQSTESIITPYYWWGFESSKFVVSRM